MKKIIYLTIYIVLFKLNYLFAYEKEKAENHYAYDLAICSSYFSYLSEMNGLDDVIKKEFSDLGLYMFVTSSKYTNKEAATARVELSSKEMRKILNKRSESWSILINKYDSLCKSIASNPQERLDYWLNKE